MARVSTKENKTIYQLTREGLKLTREEASELLETMSPERIEKIENERSMPHPDEVLLMSDKYKQPGLCNHYCANQCPIGQQYVPEIKIKELSQIVLEMLASLNSMNKQKDRLIEITADGKITDDELEDFIHIQEELERISITVETLQLWCEKMLDHGVIDVERYNAHRKCAKAEVYGDNVFEKDGIRRDRTGDGEKTRCLCGKRGIFNRDGPAMGPQIIRQLE